MIQEEFDDFYRITFDKKDLPVGSSLDHAEEDPTRTRSLRRGGLELSVVDRRRLPQGKGNGRRSSPVNLGRAKGQPEKLYGSLANSKTQRNPRP